MFREAIFQGFSGSFSDRDHHGYMDLPFLSYGEGNTPPSPGVSSDGDASEEGDSSDATLKLINQMLMEEDDLEKKPCMFQDCLALQATEKSFYDVLGEKYPPSLNQHRLCNLGRGDHESPDDDSSRTCSGESSNSSASVNNFIESDWILDQQKPDRPLYADHSTFESILQSISSSNGSGDAGDGSLDYSLVSRFQLQDSSNGSQPLWRFRGEEAKVAVAKAEKNSRGHSPDGSREKKTHIREDADYADGGRSNKQLASSAHEVSDEQLEMYDEVLLCGYLNPHSRHSLSHEFDDDSSQIGAGTKLQQNGPTKGGKARGKKQGNKKEVVDLRSLLSQCAQAVSSADTRSANELLKRLRQHSSPHGDGTERLAHYFTNALEARLAGTGTALYAAFTTKRISTADILKAYRVFVKACPYNKMSNLFANKSIAKIAQKATRLHIIDFGILYGFQWPCLIQHLSVRDGGPPKIRITGIDFPQPGFRPAERVEETGRRLETYCKRFNVPFEFTAIAKKWDTIELEDLKIDKDEALAVNCLYRLRNIPDETVVETSPRDVVLNLVKRINPDIFIHGVLNGTYNAPFFVTRFREALFHFSARFDVFEATVPREDQDRRLLEQELFGKEVMNVIACEGKERVERPETYKQWQIRNMRAGFKQLPLNQELLKEVRSKVKSHYHKDFVVDEDGNWMLQGWKGRITYALSCWKPVKDS